MSLGTNGAHGAIDVLSNFLVLPVEGPAQCLSARGSPTPFVEHFRFTHLKGSFIIQSIVHPFSLKFNLIFHCIFIIASKNENVRIKYCKKWREVHSKWTSNFRKEVPLWSSPSIRAIRDRNRAARCRSDRWKTRRDRRNRKSKESENTTNSTLVRLFVIINCNVLLHVFLFHCNSIKMQLFEISSKRFEYIGKD